MIQEKEIHDFFRDIRDPLTGVGLIDRNIVKDIQVSDEVVSATITLSEKVKSDQRVDFMTVCQNKFAALYPSVELHIHIGKAEAQNSSKENPLPQVNNIIAIASGKGGVGKSTVAVNLAITLANQGYQVGLLDGDLYGPSIPTMMGLQGEKPRVEKLYGTPKILPLKKYGISLISIGFVIEADQAVVLRGPRLGGIIKQFVQECLWPSLDYLIIDLPPGTGDIQLTLVQTIPITGALMVTTPQQVSIDDALKAMNMFLLSNINVPILGVVENMSWFTPEEDTDKKYLLFGQGGGAKLAQMGNTQLLTQLPLIQSAGVHADQGSPVATIDDHPLSPYFDALATQLESQIVKRNTDQGPSQIVHVN